MHCAACATSAQRALARVPRVDEATVDFASGRATVVGHGLDEASLESAIRGAGFVPSRVEPNRATDEDPFLALVESEQRVRRERSRRAERWRTGALVGLAIWIPLEVMHWTVPGAHLGAHAAPWPAWVAFAGATVAMIVAGGAFFSSAWRAARHGASNMDTLVSVGVLAAYGLSLWNLLGPTREGTAAPLYFAEATALIAIISLGHWIETRGSARATRDVESLLWLQPRDAERVAADGSTQTIPMREVASSMVVRVRPGGIVPVDGKVLAGTCSVDESAFTGEPLPVRRGPGESVRAGTLALDGALDIEVTASGASSALAQVARLVQEALATQAPIQRHADAACRIFVPLVLAVAGVTFFGWWMVASLDVATVNAVTVLVISCPCALGIATPLAMAVGISQASRRGIIVRRARAMERVAVATTVIFDKTGTLTEGRPRLSRVEAVAGASTEDEALALAAAAESRSEHPIGRAIVDATVRRRLHIPASDSFIAEAGVGVTARVDGGIVRVRRDTDASARLELDGALVARFWFTDDPRPSAAAAIDALRARGLGIAMLTGDRRASALEVAAKVGIAPGEVLADESPASKVQAVGKLGGTRAIMVGDGLNDAAALAASGAGLSMGSATALAEAGADATLLHDDPRAIADFYDLSRRTLSCVRQNLVFAFLYNGAAIPLAAFGLLAENGPMIAAAAMGLSDLCVVGNALRLRWILARGRKASSSCTPSPVSKGAIA